ncbi:hypothetical protein [Micromonospora sp. CPCC 206061]|uniref:hypothetical protein n=1 Tax=Micromonospora sp. CPCC 206061 TaxID=3122410 RepID=UPI002FF2D301
MFRAVAIKLPPIRLPRAVFVDTGLAVVLAGGAVWAHTSFSSAEAAESTTDEKSSSSGFQDANDVAIAPLIAVQQALVVVQGQADSAGTVTATTVTGSK